MLSTMKKELLNKKILIVDDEPELLQMVQNALFDAGFFQVYTADTCAKAILLAKSQPVALFLLDVNLPDGNGFMLYQTLRETSDAPVIFLTARGEAGDKVRGFDLGADKVLGLEMGADDYIVKPFLLSELTLRVKALLRRTYAAVHKETGFSVGDQYVDFEKAAVIRNGKETPLTPKELILIRKLWENKNKIVTNDALCLAAWGEEYYGHENTLMVHIRRLREKIEKNPSAPVHLVTVKGLGYK